jgi:hypothetical protein
MILDMLFRIGSAEKPYECFDWAQHERKLINVIKSLSVRPELRRRVIGFVFAESKVLS